MGPTLCPVLIGRSAELGSLTAALDAAGGRHGGVVFVTGDAGIGKSRLAKEVFALASARGLQVLAGRAVESTVAVAYRPITEALMGAARIGVVPDSPRIADFRAALSSLVPEWSQPGDGDAEISPVIIGEALLRLLTLPGHTGGLLVLEDLHWSDPETLAIVEYLADNIAGENVLCLATLRDSEPSAGLELVQSASARRVATRVEVGRLTARAVEQMAAACLDTRDAPPAVRRLLAGCDGLPFAVEEILAAAVSSGELVQGGAGWQVNNDVKTAMPASILGSVRNRVAALGPQVTNVIVFAAVLGRQFDWTLLASVAEVEEPEVIDALQRAHDVQLIESVSHDACVFRFRHSLTRDAIVSDLLAPDLASRSARAAAVLEQAHPDLPGTRCELAAELWAAAGQPARAARLRLTVGRRAVAQGALTSAAAALRDARKLASESPQAETLLGIEIDEALAETLALAGDYEKLAVLAEDLIARLDGAGLDPRRQALVRIRIASTSPEDHPAAAAEHLAVARAIADTLRDSELAGRVDAVSARCALDAGELDRADELARRSLAAAEDAGLGGWAAAVAFESLDVIGRRERGRDLAAARTAFERARQIADAEKSGVWRIKALHQLGTIDMLGNGTTSQLCEVQTLAHQAGAISTATIIDLQLANLWSLGTDLDRALAAAQQCQRSAGQIRSHRLEAMAISLQALIFGIRADSREAELAAERAESILPDDPEVLFTTWGQARVNASLFRDDLPRAIEESITGISHARRAAPGPRHAQGFYSAMQAPLTAPKRAWGFYALLQAVSDGDGRGAIQQAEAAGVAVSWNRGCLAYAEAVLEGQDGRRARAAELARDGGAWFTPFAPWWNHLARRLVAPAALRDGWGEPVAWMREAAGEFEVTGHDRLASACRGILRRAGERVPRSGRGTAQVPAQMRRLGVTSREMDVFLLVAQGFSNAEIAARLFISPKTVETHIASLVAKTGQAGRRELVAHAARFTA